ncbi:MAG: FAD-dependent thymidylate synthase [Candidatus Thermoplasmatota archaeon]
MKVILVAHTPDAEQTVAMAAKTCHSSKLPRGEMSRDGMRRILGLVIGSGHTSVLEHASFTFAIMGVSRALTHQLVRHRIASYSQQSQRHVKIRDFEYVTPPTVTRSPEARGLYKDAMTRISDGYSALVELGVPIEDARYVLPNATATNIVVTMNARSLLNFFELRLCLRAQWEIRRLASLMLKEVKAAAPLLFEGAGPACVTKGYCIEGQTDCRLYKRHVTKRAGEPSTGAEDLKAL